MRLRDQGEYGNIDHNITTDGEEGNRTSHLMELTEAQSISHLSTQLQQCTMSLLV